VSCMISSRVTFTTPPRASRLPLCPLRQTAKRAKTLRRQILSPHERCKPIGSHFEERNDGINLFVTRFADNASHALASFALTCPFKTYLAFSWPSRVSLYSPNGNINALIR